MINHVQFFQTTKTLTTDQVDLELICPKEERIISFKKFQGCLKSVCDDDDDQASREDDCDVCEKEEEGKTMRASSSFLRVLCVFSVWLLLLQITMVEGKDVQVI